MSDTEGMVQLMNHAADLLGARIGGLSKRNSDHVGWGDLDPTIAAMAFARGVLQMVALSVAPEGRGSTAAVIDALTEYDAWADEQNDAPTLSAGEIGAIGRFLRARLEVADS